MESESDSRNCQESESDDVTSDSTALVISGQCRIHYSSNGKTATVELTSGGKIYTAFLFFRFESAQHVTLFLWNGSKMAVFLFGSNYRFAAVLNMIRFRIAIQPDSAIQTGSGLNWISKKLNRIGYPNCIGHCSLMLNQSFFSYINRIGSNIWTGLLD